ncbi:hypothetical protein Q760_04085 [Cellulomonas cellasea DSM 20118]|uniref:Uncharacterized protein n=1 Tax=Cellulomonas cellasea DSM 20118 TaxID=1408250 RepID=A0A0A0BDN2_9CELL|nr:hypothetical protein Q760_04085 [Cellulomonas cellasea DSM 20118]
MLLGTVVLDRLGHLERVDERVPETVHLLDVEPVVGVGAQQLDEVTEVDRRERASSIRHGRLR